MAQGNYLWFAGSGASDARASVPVTTCPRGARSAESAGGFEPISSPFADPWNLTWLAPA
jgi:hypothetical protein